MQKWTPMFLFRLLGAIVLFILFLQNMCKADVRRFIVHPFTKFTEFFKTDLLVIFVICLTYSFPSFQSICLIHLNDLHVFLIFRKTLLFRTSIPIFTVCMVSYKLWFKNSNNGLQYNGLARCVIFLKH